MAIWYPGTDMEFLQANSFVKDITGQIQSSGRSLESTVSERTRQIVASNEELADTFGEGFDEIDSTLNWGFNRIEQAIGGTKASIDALRADFNYSMGLLLLKVNTTNKLLSTLIDKLDAIHKTLESPTLTQAREFFNLGCQRLSKGLLDKALEAFMEAEKKNDTDFFIQFYIGMLYLYGIDDDDNVRDLQKAKNHLLLAARYGKAEINTDPSFSKLTAEAFLLASFAIYFRLDKDLMQSDASKSRAILEEARHLASDSIKFYPEYSEATYHIAKYSALLNEPSICLAELEKAINADRNYAIKVDVDGAFDPVRPHILKLLSELKDAKMTEATNKIHEATEVWQNTLQWHPDESMAVGPLLRQCEDKQSIMLHHYYINTYFGYLDTILSAEAFISATQMLKETRIKEIRDQISETLRSITQKLPQSGRYSILVEKRIKRTIEIVAEANTLFAQTGYDNWQAALGKALAGLNEATAARKYADEEDERIAIAKRQEDERIALLKRRKKSASETFWTVFGSLFFLGFVLGWVGSIFYGMNGGRSEGGLEFLKHWLGAALIFGVVGFLLGAIGAWIVSRKN